MTQKSLKFQKLNPNAMIPTRGTDGAAGYDLYLAEQLFDQGNTTDMAHFGVAVEIPEGYCGLLLPRSSLHKKGIRQLNGVGIIDSDYRGELMAPMDAYHTSHTFTHLDAGERIAQLVIVPCFMGTPAEVECLSNTERGDGGFGSTGS